jgi:hypothetical protein
MPEDKPERRRPSQGTTVVNATFGTAYFGDSFSEVAYITPRYPSGIRSSDLKQVDQIYQRATALWWFYLNLERYDLSKGGPYFGFAEARGISPIGAAPIGTEVIGGRQVIAGFDQGTFAPGRLQAATVLQEEFANALSPEIMEQLDQILPGYWMWKKPTSRPAGSPANLAEVLAALASVLEALSDAMNALVLPPAYGGIGHNNPPDAIPLTEQERDEIVADIVKVRTATESGVGDTPSKIILAWEKTSPKLAAIGQWFLDRVTDFTTEASREAGKTVGKWGPHYILIHSLVGVGSLYLAVEALIRLLHPH